MLDENTQRSTIPGSTLDSLSGRKIFCTGMVIEAGKNRENNIFFLPPMFQEGKSNIINK